MAKNKNHHLEKRGKVWYLVAMVNGKRIKKALAQSITDARRLRDEYLNEIRLNGDIPRPQPEADNLLFGDVVWDWAKKKVKRVKSSSWRDYRSSMNGHILPRFGNVPIRDITCYDVEEFVDSLTCGNKRKNNILVPMRDVFKHAAKGGLVEKNIMFDVERLKPEDPDIRPLTFEEVEFFLDDVHPHYRYFFVVAFYTGMRFGEMAGLKWRNVDFDRRVIRVVETRVYGEEGPPKTKKSKRDIDMLKPACDALMKQRKITGKSKYVFLDMNFKPLTPDHVRKVIWTPALEKAGIEYRPMLQTRHTFATMMLDGGEDIGWVQNQISVGYKTNSDIRRFR
jgi:integrase